MCGQHAHAAGAEKANQDLTDNNKRQHKMVVGAAVGEANLAGTAEHSGEFCTAVLTRLVSFKCFQRAKAASTALAKQTSNTGHPIFLYRAASTPVPRVMNQ